MPATPNGLPYPPGSAAPDVPYWNQQLAEALDAFVGDTGWITATPIPPYTFQPDFDCQVRQIGPVVYLRGGFTGSNIPENSHVDVATIPTKFVAPNRVYVTVAGSSAARVGRLDIKNDGTMTISTGSSSAYYLMDGITWTVN